MERVELHCYTDKSKNGFGFARELIEKAVSLGQKGIAVTDYLSARSFYEAQKEAKEYDNFKVIYGSEIHLPESNITILCKNNKGKNTLYRLITETSKNFDFKCLEQYQFDAILKNNRNNLLLGASCVKNEIIERALENNFDEVKKAMQKYDYIEVAPIGIYLDNYDTSEEEVKNIIKQIIGEANKQNIPVIATNYVAYANKEDKEAYEALLDYRFENHLNILEAYQHLMSTEEMINEFSWLNDDKLVEDIVINNTNVIYDKCELFQPFNNYLNLPHFQNDFEEISRLCLERCHYLYGETIDEKILKRLDKELKLIKDNNFSSIYLLAYRIADICRKLSSSFGIRGQAGSSLVVYLLGISKCNPLPPHYYCPICHKFEWADDVLSGYDLPTKQCSNCNSEMIRDGHNLEFETFAGLEGERVPYFTFNVTREFYENRDKILRMIVDEGVFILSRIYANVNYGLEKDLVADYFANRNIECDDTKANNMISLLDCRYLYTQIYSPKLLFIPKNIDIYDYTPIEYLRDGTISTHIEEQDLLDNFINFYIIEHIDKTIIKKIFDDNEELDHLDILDPILIDLFKDNTVLDIKSINYHPLTKLGTIGLSLFDPSKTRELIEKLKPTKFSDLVKIMGLSFGSGVWENNAEELINKGVPLNEIISSRDDVMRTLLKYGVDREDAFIIMENIRKGKGLLKEQETIIKEHNLPDWFINSCNKIEYLWLEAHIIESIKIELLFASLKIYFPKLFYEQYIKYRVDEYDKDYMNMQFDELGNCIHNMSKYYDNNYYESTNENLNIAEVIYEMEARGIELDL